MIAGPAGQLRTVLPFELIDCRTGCAAGQWFELHALFWDPGAGPFLGYGIMYFRPPDGGKSGRGVTVGYQFSLSPAGERSIMSTYPDATWSFD